jgi:hypothetical protein
MLEPAKLPEDAANGLLPKLFHQLLRPEPMACPNGVELPPAIMAPKPAICDNGEDA